MKKLFAALAGLFMMAGAFFPTEAQAQKGDMTLGIMGGFSTYNDGGFTNVYFQYSIADHFRIAPDLGYVFRNKGASAFVLDVDLHVPFKIVRQFGVYPLVGFTFNNWSYRGDGNASRAGANFGAGFDIYLTDYLKLTLQGKYSLMNDTSGGFFGMGLGYVF